MTERGATRRIVTLQPVPNGPGRKLRAVFAFREKSRIVSPRFHNLWLTIHQKLRLRTRELDLGS